MKFEITDQERRIRNMVGLIIIGIAIIGAFGFIDTKKNYIAVNAITAKDATDLINGYYQSGWHLNRVINVDLETNATLQDKEVILIFERNGN